MLELLVAVAAGYVLGSIPFAYLVARARGVDIFAVGTRNPGAANVFRQVGAVPGSIVFVADVAKSAAAVGVAVLLIGPEARGAATESGFVLAETGMASEWRALAGLSAIAGHWWPVFLRFRGGAGLACAIGASAALLPVAGVVALPAGLLVRWRFRNSGYSAAVGLVVFLGVGIWVGDWRMALVASSTFAAVFGYYMVVGMRGRYQRRDAETQIEEGSTQSREDAKR